MKKEYVAPEYHALQYIFSDAVAYDDNLLDVSGLFPKDED